MEFEITFDLLPALAVVLSLAAFYLPGFDKWYGGLEPKTKQLFNVGVSAIVAVAVWGLGWTGQIDIYEASFASLWNVAVDIAVAIAMNAGVYKALNYTRS